METDATLAPDTARIGIDIIRLDHIMRFEPLSIDRFDWIAGMGMFVGTEHGSFPLWKRSMMDGLIATMLLDPIDSLVSMFVEDRESLFRLKPFGDLDGLDADAHGDRDGHHLPIGIDHADGVSCQQSAELTCLLLSCLGTDSWPADPELFATAAGDDIARPVIEEARDAPGQFDQYSVADRVAVGVVDQLEVVDVDHHQGDDWQLAPFPVHIIREVRDATGQGGEFSPEVFVKGSPIVETGQGIGPCCLLEIDDLHLLRGDMRLLGHDNVVLGHDLSCKDGQLVEPALGQSLGLTLEEAEEGSGQDVIPGIILLPTLHEDADGMLQLSIAGLTGQELFLEMFNLRHGVLLGCLVDEGTSRGRQEIC